MNNITNNTNNSNNQPRKNALKTLFDCMKSEDETAKWIINHKLSRADFTIHELKLNVRWKLGKMQ